MFPPENMVLVDLNSPTEPNLIANSIEIYELTNMDVVIIENENDLDHLIVPLCADAIEIECQVLKSKHIVIQDKANIYFHCILNQ
jgi:hypothetical protein